VTTDLLRSPAFCLTTESVPLCGPLRVDRRAGKLPGRRRHGVCASRQMPRGPVSVTAGVPRMPGSCLLGAQASASMAKVLPSGSWNHAMRPPPALAVMPLPS
jgi:hypothetical protein